MRITLLFGAVFFYSVSIFGQITLSANIFDSHSKGPIKGTHFFLTNTSFGSISDEKGYVTITFPDYMEEDLIISCESYDIQSFKHSQYNNVKVIDTIWLQPRKTDTPQLIESLRNDKQRKRHFSLFRKYFIGEGFAGRKTIIENPEVLSFQENDEGLRASVSGFLKIRNELLGYELNYYLEHFLLRPDGYSEYFGQVLFTDISGTNKKSFERTRRGSYNNSLRYFLRSAAVDSVESNGFKVNYAVMESGKFVEKDVVRTINILKYDASSKVYALFFPEFLKITNENLINTTGASSKKRLGNLERTRLKSFNQGQNIGFDENVSYLHKYGFFLKFDHYGRVLNPFSLHGSWSNQRIAFLLPHEYGLPSDSLRKIN